MCDGGWRSTGGRGGETGRRWRWTGGRRNERLSVFVFVHDDELFVFPADFSPRQSSQPVPSLTSPVWGHSIRIFPL